MRILTLVFLLFNLAGPVFSQIKKEKQPGKFEIGLNITSTLAGFFNSGGDRIPTDPFLFSLKIGGKKSAFRTGLNIRSNQKDESSTDINGTRTTFDTQIDARFGWEWRREISRKFRLHYGLDGLLVYRSTTSDFNSSIGLATLKSHREGAGGGPFLGMSWLVHPRVTFGTEATLYATVFRKTESRNVPLEVQVTKNAVGFDLFSLPPTSLYIHFNF